MLLIVHCSHVNDCNPAPHCAMCDNCLEVQVSLLGDTTIHVAASTEVSRALGPNSM
jgi:hypothetical protein